LNGDAPAGEVFELADEVALPAPAVNPGFVVSRAEVVEAGGGVGQQVPHEHHPRHAAPSVGSSTGRAPAYEGTAWPVGACGGPTITE